MEYMLKADDSVLMFESGIMRVEIDMLMTLTGAKSWHWTIRSEKMWCTIYDNVVSNDNDWHPYEDLPAPVKLVHMLVT